MTSSELKTVARAIREALEAWMADNGVETTWGRCRDLANVVRHFLPHATVAHCWAAGEEEGGEHYVALCDGHIIDVTGDQFGYGFRRVLCSPDIPHNYQDVREYPNAHGQVDDRAMVAAIIRRVELD